MSKAETIKTKAKRPAGDLTTLEITKITDQLVSLRKKIRDTGATALSPTSEWDGLRKEIALLNKTLNADTAAKLDASKAELAAREATV